ncbi:hypothetical protein LTR66_008556 [Elasticomyces elasticus]|nr:hypothetical protein LTR66_008556 [Elasticomyces elasticus]
MAPVPYFQPCPGWENTEQAIKILAANGPPKPTLLNGRPENIHVSSSSSSEYEPDTDDRKKQSAPEQGTEDDLWLYSRFLAAVWDSLAKDTYRDLVSFEVLAHKLWLPFTKPIRDMTCGARDFTRLMISQRLLFQSEDAVSESIIPSSGPNVCVNATLSGVKGKQRKFLSPHARR